MTIQSAAGNRFQNNSGQMIKQKLSQTKSCGSSAFSSFDSCGSSVGNSNSYLNIVGAQSQKSPNRQFSHSTRNLNSSVESTFSLPAPTLSPFQQQQRQSYLHIQQQHQQQQHHNNNGSLHCHQQPPPQQNRLVKSFSLSSPSAAAICSSSKQQQSNPNMIANNKQHYISVGETDLFGSKVSMPSVTITAETPVTANAAFDAFDSNHQFHRSASAQPLHQQSFCGGGGSTGTNSIRSTPTAPMTSGQFGGSPFQSQSQLYPGCGFSSSASMLNQNSINNRKHSGVCSPVMPSPVGHQTVSRNLSAPETQSHNQLHPSAFSSANNNHLFHQSPSPSMMFQTGSNNSMQRVPSGPIGSGSSSNSMESIDKERNRIRFHLSSLFQDQQVSRAMELLGPTETNITVIIEQIMKQQQQQQ